MVLRPRKLGFDGYATSNGKSPVAGRKNRLIYHRVGSIPTGGSITF